MRKIIIIATIQVVFILSCKENPKNKQISFTNDSTKNSELTSVPIDTLIFPTENDGIAKVIQTGNFHEDEIKKEYEKERWVGLFTKDQHYYLKETSIKIKKIKDQIVDEDNQMTGWNVSTTIKDTALVLISGIDNLLSKNVVSIIPNENELFPNKSINIKWGDTEYKLTATGQIKQMGENWEEIQNYKVFLIANKNGSEIKQLICAKPVNESNVYIYWIGDMDGDNQLDLILDTSTQENVTTISVYLSSKSGKGELVKFIGLHTSVGC